VEGGAAHGDGGGGASASAAAAAPRAASAAASAAARSLRSLRRSGSGCSDMTHFTPATRWNHAVNHWVLRICIGLNPKHWSSYQIIHLWFLQLFSNNFT
jgi:hypothetical protein